MEELKRLGRYEIVRVLGSGAMGIVYEADDTKLHRRVAIKTIIKSALTDPEMLADYSERFMREAQAVAKLNHPNIVAIYDFGEEGDVSYFVMEFIQGQELKSFLDSDVQFSQEKSLGLMINLLDALDYAHSQGIVHRDIKPANIMLDKAGRLKLTDFGVVKVLENKEGTQAGTMVGTPGYMSPEQILGTGVSPRSDIFAAGVILYQLLTWRKPFTGEGVFTIQQKIVNEHPVLPSTLNSRLPPALDRIVSKALAKKPEDRYTHARDFAEDIRQFMAASAAQQQNAPEEVSEKTMVMGSNAASHEIEKTLATGSRPAASAADEKTVASFAPGGEEVDELERILAERARLDSAIQNQFTRQVTIMFTDLKGSTAIAETEGDIVSRMLIKQETEIIKPAIASNNGVFVKSIGDGTLSYFENALDALRAAAHIQKGMDELNMSKKFKFPVLMRIGMHTGSCVVEKNDVYGDVVNTASRFESAADPGGILMSEDTYNALSDKAEIYCRFVKQVVLKGKKEPFNAYKAFWNPREIEADQHGLNTEQAPPVRSSGMKLVWGGLILLGLVLALTLGSKYLGSAQKTEAKRSITDTVAPQTLPDSRQ